MSAILGFPIIVPFDPADGSLRISDDNLSEFPALLRNRNLRKVRVSIRSNPLYVFELEKFLLTCSNRKIRVNDLALEELFRHPDNIQGSVLLRPLQEVLSRCSMRFYMGQLDNSFVLPDTMEILHISVPNNDAFQPLKKIINSGKHQLGLLCINLRVSSVDIEKLLPLKGVKGWPPSLFLPDIYAKHITKVVGVAEALLPTDRRMFGSLFFPRYKAKASQIINELIDSDIKVSGGIFLPSTCLPPTRGEQSILEFLAEDKLGAKCGIVWD
ncbi:uncharacterized protein [Palaemon carinicauda]|uniref:uncharacterized protein isoform X2 n=1 Tax=Palaemon carinicauda TaxID=392227 RepID=UPI0035B57305